jgi:hypothetical protein
MWLCWLCSIVIGTSTGCALGASEPEMPPFDPSKYEPMPEVEIDPDDEFHVGKQT